MDPQLLPVEIPNLQHAEGGEERTHMIAAPLSGHQAGKLPLVHLKGAPQDFVSACMEIPPHHEAVLKVWEDQPIISLLLLLLLLLLIIAIVVIFIVVFLVGVVVNVVLVAVFASAYEDDDEDDDDDVSFRYTITTRLFTTLSQCPPKQVFLLLILFGKSLLGNELSLTPIERIYRWEFSLLFC